jgi:hypothetical protein
MLCDLFGIAELTDQLFVPTTQEFNADITCQNHGRHFDCFKIFGDVSRMFSNDAGSQNSFRITEVAL